MILILHWCLLLSVNLLGGQSIGRWFTPNGRLIEEIGIEPDVEIDFDAGDVGNNPQFAEGGDPQIDAAVQQLNFQLGQ